MVFMLAHAFPALTTRSPIPECGRIKFFGRQDYCVITATVLFCIACYSNLDDLPRNSIQARSKKRRKVVRKTDYEKLADCYYELLTWVARLMKADNNFPSRMAKWEMEIFRSKRDREIFKFMASQKDNQNRNENNGHNPSTVNRRTRHRFDPESDLDLFSCDPLGLLNVLGEARMPV